MGILAEYGWAHRVTPFLFIFCARTTDLELGSTVCPLLVIFGNDHNTAALDLQPKNGPGENQPPGPIRPPRTVCAGSSISAWPAVGSGTRRASGAHFKGIEKNLFPDLQRTCSACTRSSISESSNSSTISCSSLRHCPSSWRRASPTHQARLMWNEGSW